jgi:UDP-N-acetylglucosamine acyltransferase
LIGGTDITENISSTAIIDPSARLGKNVHVGHYTIIGKNVLIGDDTWIDSHANIKQFTNIGKKCKVYNGAVVGEIPQDLKFLGEKSELIIGDSTTIREFCTLNRGTEETGYSKIGSNCLLMAYVHVAHDCIIGDHSILANGVQLGGHVTIGNHVTIGGMTPVHQFCKVGDYSFIGGGYRIVQDVPPYILAMGEPLKFSGLNSIGLRRKNFSPDIRKQMKRAYQLIYQSDLNRSQAVSQIKKDFNSTPEINHIVDFIENSNRGLV